MSETEPSDSVTTEAEALADILAWSLGRPLWQRDALRRLAQTEELTDKDTSDLTAICKDQTLPAQPLTADHVRAPDAGMPAVRLRAMRDVLNVNALPEEQRLGFLTRGVTIVYGDNGSGKSGYVRILKRACRARGPNERILQNIYTAPAGPQQAVIDFNAGTQDQSERWTNGLPSAPLLSGVSVFDSSTANVHVDETNNVAYTPFPMKLLERLVQACRAVIRADGHLFVTVIAYQLVQVIRTRLRQAGENASWTTLRRILEGQQRITATFRRADGRTLHVRKATRAEPPQQAIYDALGIGSAPGGISKTVV